MGFFIMVTNSGYIKLHRKFTEGPRYFAEPFCRNMAWVDLLLLANHAQKVFYVRGIMVTIERGQTGYSSDALARRWRWSRGKVTRFLNVLEMDRQIVQQKNNVTNIISIVNYEMYQGNGTANGTANGQQTDSKRTLTINDKNEKKDICTVGAALPVDDFYRNEIEKSGGDKNFEMVVSFILGSNDIEKRLNNILKVKEQLSYDQFKKIWEKYRKLNDGTKLSNILLTMENDPKYTKNKVSLYLTLNNWISKRFVK